MAAQWAAELGGKGHSDGATVNRTQKSPAKAGLSVKRLKGFEPSTFCMANDPPSSRPGIPEPKGDQRAAERFD